MTSLTLDATLAQRLAVQRLSAAPFVSVTAAVGSLVCVQCQEHAISRWSLGARTGLSDPEVRAQLDSRAVVRTHILRPTWHYVAAADLRWLLALTSSKVVSALAARHRQLGIGATERDRAATILEEALTGRTALTRRELHARFAERGLAESGEQVGHLLMLAELDGLICSGPLRGDQHTYVLADEVIPPTPARDRDDALRELVRRFFAGHGPARDRDLTRWTKVTLGEIRPILHDLEHSGELARHELDGQPLWGPTEVPERRPDAPRAFLVQLYDEVIPYTDRFPLAPGRPQADRADWIRGAASGFVICDGVDVGQFGRRIVGDRVQVTLRLAPGLPRSAREAIAVAADQLAGFTGQQLALEWG